VPLTIPQTELIISPVVPESEGPKFYLQTVLNKYCKVGLTTVPYIVVTEFTLPIVITFAGPVVAGVVDPTPILIVDTLPVPLPKAREATPVPAPPAISTEIVPAPVASAMVTVVGVAAVAMLSPMLIVAAAATVFEVSLLPIVIVVGLTPLPSTPPIVILLFVV
jgi:hypothetical protein